MIRKNKMLMVLIALIFITACQQHKTTDSKTSSWVINPDFSSISIITTKNSKVSEVSQFKSFSGSINENNYLNVVIDLASLETNIAIRNERIQKHLFQTDIYATAEIHTQLKPEDLTVGVHEISFEVDLHGVSGIINAEFMVFEQFGNKVITLHKPLIIKAETFALETGITTLRKIAKLQSIDFTVPVNLTLSFERKYL
jgi:polyisoprenoid-binding protein YceI